MHLMTGALTKGKLNPFTLLNIPREGNLFSHTCDITWEKDKFTKNIWYEVELPVRLLINISPWDIFQREYFVGKIFQKLSSLFWQI